MRETLIAEGSDSVQVDGPTYKLCRGRKCLEESPDGKSKLISEFYGDKSKRDGLSSSCKECCAHRGKKWYRNNKEKANEHAKQWAQKNREASRQAKRRWKEKNPGYHQRWYEEHSGYSSQRRRHREYGLSPEDQEGLLQQQDYKCAICGRTDSGIPGKGFALDHNHQTGRPRGFLCVQCNVAIGMLGESPDLVEEWGRGAARYLRGHEGSTDEEDGPR